MLTDPLLQAIESDTVWLESCNFCNLHKLWVQLNAYNLLNLIKDILNLAGFRETKNIHPLYIVHITIRSVWVCIYIPLYLRVYITCVYIIYMCMYTSILYYSYIYIHIYVCVLYSCWEINRFVQTACKKTREGFQPSWVFSWPSQKKCSASPQKETAHPGYSKLRRGHQPRPRKFSLPFG